MSRTTLSLSLALALIVAACSGADSDQGPPAARPSLAGTTSTSTIPTTTTTIPPFTVENAPEGLSTLIEDFYAYAGSGDVTPPTMPAAVLESINPSAAVTPVAGTASLGEFKGQQVGVVEMESDVFLVVDDGEGWRIVGGDWPSVSVAPYFGPTPRLVAVVGSDARPGQTVERTRADSIHFVGLDGSGSGAIVGIPRDSYIPVPGFGKKKVTASLALGGPDTMMETFDELTGLPLEGYVLTGFAGFESLVGSVLGGVEVDVPLSINDRWAHVTLEAGQQLLDGAQALGFSRARKTVPRGDFTRSEHQGIVLLGALGMVKKLGYGALPGLMEASEPFLFTNLTPEQILTFSALAISTDPDQIDNVVAQGSTGRAAGASVVFLNNSVGDLFADLADGQLDN